MGAHFNDVIIANLPKLTFRLPRAASKCVYSFIHLLQIFELYAIFYAIQMPIFFPSFRHMRIRIGSHHVVKIFIHKPKQLCYAKQCVLFPIDEKNCIEMNRRSAFDINLCG